jgi:hypothetical protein
MLQPYTKLQLAVSNTSSRGFQLSCLLLLLIGQRVPGLHRMQLTTSYLQSGLIAVPRACVSPVVRSGLVTISVRPRCNCM